MKTQEGEVLAIPQKGPPRRRKRWKELGRGEEPHGLAVVYTLNPTHSTIPVCKGAPRWRQAPLTPKPTRFSL